MEFRYFVINVLGNKSGPLFEQTWMPFTQICFVSRLVEIGPVIMEKKIYLFRQCD